MKKIKLIKAGYSGSPYKEGDVLEVEESEATFAVNSGAAIYADEGAEITPLPTPVPPPKPDKPDKSQGAEHASDKAKEHAQGKPFQPQPEPKGDKK